MRITFELDSSDLKRFHAAFTRARRLAADADEVDIIDAAKLALDSLCMTSVPTYVRKRLVHVQRLLLMFEDNEWVLPAPERIDALAALAYFGDPEDLIPDHLDVIGLLDDAVMLELLARRMRHVLDAYTRFCDFRATLAETCHDTTQRIARSRSLTTYRTTLMAAMQVRARRSAMRSPGTA